MLPGASCACKGVRSCLLCEPFKNTHLQEDKVVHLFFYDPERKLAVRKDAEPSSFAFPGVFLWENFLSEEEETELISSMDREVWNPSQSGRRKQDFGPKVNFKKKKVRLASFSGLPALSKKLVLRMQQEATLADFQPVEQCNLDYHPGRGSAIDPHLDDAWLWGERLVTVNMLSDTTMTMSLERGLPPLGPGEEVNVALALPRRSLVALYGEARHRWKHGILRKDVNGRRVCSTYRELSAEFLPGGPQAEQGARLLDVALSFMGAPV
ncbi:alpha-ketoglutarate-dependent dioxygenase alkB homolog 4 [Entelurus aequoreus]|uniref:alpha-ketoglutarate-dependent dioxygenase alkB homolog 4 n=1 Tax=Entelurus aequoreus TaxID=161455 RepID=UPI002B1E0D52|nr:alpha-ketoglutarate-dependent dioxygenase alkB homolog 4 [Entelurus aequoreus]